MRRDPEPILRALCDVGRPLMRKGGLGLDSCIASCRIGMDVLRRFGVHSAPLAVKAAAFNATGHQFMLDGHPEWVKERRDGAYALGAGYGPGPRSDAWNGHLVLIVGSSHLLDLSADQLARPAHGIHVEAMVAALPKHGLFAPTDRIVAINPRGGAVVYEADPRNAAWRAAPDWNRERWSSLTDQVERAVRNAVACPSEWAHCQEAF